MPIYEYEHRGEACSRGRIFEVWQSVEEAPLTKCPTCRMPVYKIISATSYQAPKTNRELRDLGFTKLVRRDDGVYENVTARDGQSKVMLRDKPETIPDLSKTIRD